jgi:hypothetical protein
MGPDRGQCSRVSGKDGGVQPGDVDAQFQRVGRRDPEQLAGAEGALQFPALLGQIPTPVRGDLARQLRRHLVQPALRGQGGLLGAVPRPDEGQRPGPGGDQVGHHPCRLGRCGPADRCPVLALGAGQHRRFPQHEIGARLRRAVVGDRPNRSAEQLTRGPGRISGRGGREDENRVGAVQPGEPDEPTEHQGDV